MIAVILPSRGLMFSKTAEEIVRNVKNIPHKFFFSHKRPLPECFEEPTRRALADEDISHLWFVEDDMILPDGLLKELIQADQDAIACDYPTTNKGQGGMFIDSEGTVVFSGTGCLLVKREVFNRLRKPYFTTKYKWNFQNYGDHLRFTSFISGKKQEGYGLHDVTFGLRLYAQGTPIIQHPTVLGQRKLIALGKQGTNDGAHQIEEWTMVTPNYLAEEIKNWPEVPHGNLISVDIDGKRLETDEKNAERLIKAGVAKAVPWRPIVIDDAVGAL